jgi:hypothetical protein
LHRSSALFFLHLIFCDKRAGLQKMNAAISFHNKEESENNIISLQSQNFLTGFALLIDESSYSNQGKLLWLIEGLLFFFLLMFFILQVETFGL